MSLDYTRVDDDEEPADPWPEAAHGSAVHSVSRAIRHVNALAPAGLPTAQDPETGAMLIAADWSPDVRAAVAELNEALAEADAEGDSVAVVAAPGGLYIRAVMPRFLHIR